MRAQPSKLKHLHLFSPHAFQIYRLGLYLNNVAQPCFHVCVTVCCVRSGGLASRVRRKDTLALRLEKQERDAQENQDGSSWQSREQWLELRNRIGTTLNR